MYFLFISMITLTLFVKIKKPTEFSGLKLKAEEEGFEPPEV